MNTIVHEVAQDSTGTLASLVNRISGASGSNIMVQLPTSNSLTCMSFQGYGEGHGQWVM